jgi:hypothetical protein
MTKEIKLTDVRREALELLDAGGIMEIDSSNLGSIGDRDVAPVTRDFLTSHRLVTRLDKSKAVTTRGNGFVITDRGREVLEADRDRRKGRSFKPKRPKKDVEPPPPSDAQLAYAKKVGIRVPQGANQFDVSDLLTNHEERDKLANELHRSHAEYFGVEVRPYVGKKTLFNLIFHRLSKKGREAQLAQWFAFRVHRTRTVESDDAGIQSPADPRLVEVGKRLAEDPRIIKSIRRYQGEDLSFFGTFVSKNGTEYTGGSQSTIAYKETVKALSRIGGMQKSAPVAESQVAPQKVKAARPAVESSKKENLSLIDPPRPPLAGEKKPAQKVSFKKRADRMPTGCLSMIGLVIVLPVAAGVSTWWLLSALF